MSDIAERIEELMKENGVAPREIKRTLSDICGISYQAVSQWFSGSTKNIESKHLAKIASKYGASLEWLVTGEQPPPNLPPGTRWHPVIAWETPDDLPPDEYVIIPRVNVKFSAGSGQIAYEVEVWLFFKHSASFL